MARVLIPTWRGVDVARHAGRRDDLGVGRGGGVEERQAVVDAGVDIDDERGPVGSSGHPPMLAERIGHSRDGFGFGQAVDVDELGADPGRERFAQGDLVGQERLRSTGHRRAGGRRRRRTGRPGRRARHATRRPRRPAPPSASRQPDRSTTLAAALMTLGSGLASASRSCAASRACIASTPSRSRSSRTVSAGGRLDVGVGIAPRPTEPVRRAHARRSSCRRP